MEKVCIIGSSHVAAIRDGWSLAADVTSNVEPTFFAAPGDTLADTRVENGRLVPTTIQASRKVLAISGAPYVEIKDYHRFLLVGLGLRFIVTLQIYDRYRLAKHAEDSHIIISRGALDATLRGLVHESVAFSLAKRIRLVTNRPVVVIPDPLVTEAALTLHARWRRFGKCQHRDFLYGLFTDAVRAMFETVRASVVFQPPETTVNKVFTKPEFSEGSIKIGMNGEPHQPNDFGHMNALFGALLLRSALAESSSPIVSD